MVLVHEVVNDCAGIGRRGKVTASGAGNLVMEWIHDPKLGKHEIVQLLTCFG